jgi:hypothetical protein
MQLSSDHIYSDLHPTLKQLYFDEKVLTSIDLNSLTPYMYTKSLKEVSVNKLDTFASLLDSPFINGPYFLINVILPNNSILETICSLKDRHDGGLIVDCCFSCVKDDTINKIIKKGAYRSTWCLNDVDFSCINIIKESCIPDEVMNPKYFDPTPSITNIKDSKSARTHFMLCQYNETTQRFDLAKGFIRDITSYSGIMCCHYMIVFSCSSGKLVELDTTNYEKTWLIAPL